MFILTGKAIDFAKDFVERDEEWKRRTGEETTIELDEDSQIDLYHIMSMYERDERYQSFMRGCSALYSVSITEGPDSYHNLIDKFRKMMREAVGKAETKKRG